MLLLQWFFLFLHCFVALLRNFMYISDCITKRMSTKIKIFGCPKWTNAFNFTWKLSQSLVILSAYWKVTPNFRRKLSTLLFKMLSVKLSIVLSSCGSIAIKSPVKHFVSKWQSEKNTWETYFSQNQICIP